MSSPERPAAKRQRFAYLRRLWWAYKQVGLRGVLEDWL